MEKSVLVISTILLDWLQVNDNYYQYSKNLSLIIIINLFILFDILYYFYTKFTAKLILNNTKWVTKLYLVYERLETI